MNVKTNYKYIVIGCGGIGSAVLYWLSKTACGNDVLGIEQFQLGHVNGGSQDHSRSIRLVYHDEIYNSLTPEAFKAWGELQEDAGIQVLYKTGGLVIAEKGVTDQVVTQYIKDIESRQLPYELMTGSQLREKYPQFTTDDSILAVYQKDIGIVDAQTANALHIQLARGRGVTVVENCPVRRISRTSDGKIEINTDKQTYTCEKVIVTAGAWINQVLGCISVHLPIYVTQEQVTYFATPTPKYLTKDKLPIWIYHSENHDIYGISIHGSTGFKVGIDVGGPLVTTDTRTFTPDPIRENISRRLLEKILPSAVGPMIGTKTCLYTMPPDRNFIIDTCVRFGYHDVIICNGAGHAYKFAGVLGKILSELAVEGETRHDIKAFKMDRQALTDPEYKPNFYLDTRHKDTTVSKL